MQSSKLGDLVHISIGRTPSRSNNEFWDKERQTGNIWLSIADLLNVNGRTITDSKEYITGIAANAFEIIPKGTLLVSFKLTLGRLAFAGCNLRTNEAIAALRNDESKVLNEYLYYSLSYFDWMSYAAADKKVKGFTLNKAKLNEIKILYPESLEEQQRIVTKLDAGFEKIDKSISLAMRNREKARTYFPAWVEQVFAEKSRSWQSATLKDLVDFKGGGTPSKSVAEYWAGDLPWVSPKDMKSIEVNDSIDHISDKAVRNSSTSIIPKDSVLLVVRSGILAHTIPLAINTVDVTLNQDMKALIPKSIIRNDALFSILLALRPRMFGFVSKGATVHRINFDQLKNLALYYPNSLDEQGIFAAQCEKVMKKSTNLVELYDAKINKLKLLKQSMLHRAFSESAVK